MSLRVCIGEPARESHLRSALCPLPYAYAYAPASAPAYPPGFAAVDAAIKFVHNGCAMSSEYSPPVPLLWRFLPALLLDRNLYRELASDPGTRFQAFLVVLMAGVFNGFALRSQLAEFAFWAGVIASMGHWVMSTALVHVVARLFGLHLAGRSIARPLAFSDVPSFFLLLAAFPLLATIVRLLVPLALLVTAVPAIEAAYETTRSRAAWISVISFVAYMLFGVVLGFAVA